MSTKPAWLEALPEITKARSDADVAVRELQESLSALTGSLGGNEAAAADAYAASYGAWTSLANRTERLAGLGLALEEEYPTQAKYLVGGTVVELLENVLDAGAVLSGSLGQAAEDPLQYLRQQPRALEAAQELVTAVFPDSASQYKQRFESLGLPTAGIGAVAGTAETAGPKADRTSQDVLRILHISDLHRTPDESVGNAEVTSDLLQAIKDFGDGPFDLILLTGDITQTASESEYQQAESFLSNLVDKLLAGKKDRLILAAGNHDITWDNCRKQPFLVHRVEDEKRRSRVPGALRVPGVDIVPSEQVLRAGQAEFRKFYERLFGSPYPEALNERYVYHQPSDVPLGILVVDTTEGIHHVNDEAQLNRDALVAGLDRVREADPRRFIIVGHHGPIRTKNQRDGVEAWCLDRMLDSRAVAYLHGHVHETQVAYYSRDGILGLSCLGVGSLVAGPQTRPESSPRQYHVVELPLQGRAGRVLVRRKDRRDTRWTPDTRYGPVTRPLDYLEFRA